MNRCPVLLRELACAVHQPGPCVRALCEAVAVLLSKNMTCARPRCNAMPSKRKHCLNRVWPIVSGVSEVLFNAGTVPPLFPIISSNLTTSSRASSLPDMAEVPRGMGAVC